MPRSLAAFLVVIVLVTNLPTSSFAAQDNTTACTDFDAWQWAQTVYESDPDSHSSLDPDGDGIACPDLPRSGFAPILWADSIPADAQTARIDSIIDGDTFNVIIDGIPDTIRMYHINTPEFGGESGPQQCGAEEATGALSFILDLVPDQTVFLEYDETKRDQYDRRLAYVWFEFDGNVYMVNETMVRNGWAESETYEPDVRYRSELSDAEEFSIRHQLGVRDLCGTFGVEIQPSHESGQPQGGDAPWSAAESAPPAADTSAGCEPSYPEVCIPLRSEVGDLDCGDISERRFTVIPPDAHNFDGDHDGVGCEGS